VSLIDEIKGVFETAREEQTEETGPVVVTHRLDEELANGFNAMRGYYQEQILAITRRGYRHFAGSAMPHSADLVLLHTDPVMRPLMVALLFQAFTDGVLIAHEDDQEVKMAIHFHNVDDLFADDEFREKSTAMATGFADDEEVLTYFSEYVQSALAQLAHLTGFAHTPDAEPSKVWDVWILAGTATISAGYLAGAKLGSSWKERDVLDGIAIASGGEPDVTG